MVYGFEEFVDGQHCDETGSGRSTIVQFACEPSLRGDDGIYIAQVEEVKVCSYIITVGTQALCQWHQEPRQKKTIKQNKKLKKKKKKKIGRVRVVCRYGIVIHEMSVQVVAAIEQGLYFILPFLFSATGRPEDIPKPPPGTAADLLHTIAGQCFEFSEGWWTYELCVGMYIRQYHKEGDSVSQEYFLGKKATPSPSLSHYQA